MKKRESKKHPARNIKTKERGTQYKRERQKKAENEAWRCPICDMNWEDDDGENGQWLGCQCGQWFHEECIEYELDNPQLVCPNCNCV